MENLIFLGVPKIWANYSLIIMCLNIGTLNNHHFPFGTNGKVVVLGVPILKHFRIILYSYGVLTQSSHVVLTHGDPLLRLAKTDVTLLLRLPKMTSNFYLKNFGLLF